MLFSPGVRSGYPEYRDRQATPLRSGKILSACDRFDDRIEIAAAPCWRISDTLVRRTPIDRVSRASRARQVSASAGTCSRLDRPRALLAVWVRRLVTLRLNTISLSWSEKVL
jgi:hypothetical protein